MLYLIKLFFPEKKKIVTSKVLTCPFLLSYVWSSQWSRLLQKAEGYNENRPCLTLMKPTQTICEGLYITGGNFERSKSSFVLVICACTSIKSASRFCEDKPWSRGKPPQKWIFQNVDYGYVQTKPDEFSIGGNSCVWAFRSHGTMPNVRKFERRSVQKFEHQNRGRIYSRCSQQFYRHGVNTLNIEIFVQRRRGCMDTW